MSEENQLVNQCQHCGNIQLLRDKNKCSKCGYRTLEQVSLIEAIELEDSFQGNLPEVDFESETQIVKDKELRQLATRATGYLVSALVAFFAGAITLGVSAPYAMALGAYSMGGQAIIGVIVGFLLLSISGVFSIAWLFTSTMSLHAAAIVNANGKS